ncbi:MAG: hypothetical protein LQ342_003845 [Letrouitia transgressa]|nr:MAG: hypothetical protein LQ342_003845 [Letrouitia transgressa]
MDGVGGETNTGENQPLKPPSPQTATETDAVAQEARSRATKLLSDQIGTDVIKEEGAVESTSEKPPVTPPPGASVSMMDQETLQVRDSFGAKELGSPFEAESYFMPRALPPSNIGDHSRTTSASTPASSTPGSIHGLPNCTSAPHSPEVRHALWRHHTPPSTNAPTSNPKPARPNSVPSANISSSSTRKRREGSEYPNYPNQSFAAFQSQNYALSNQPHPLRTRNSNPSHNSSFSSIPSSRSSRDNIPLITGAKTVGNTPAQSPGLFSPVYPTSRNHPEESEGSQTNTPLLHPAHLQTPKETHKLLKDIDPISGRKLVNNYELYEKLGSGMHGTVKRGRNLETGDIVAVKIVRRHARKRRLGRSGDPNDTIKKEVAILKKARHPHVVSLLEVIDDHEFGKVYLILEYVELGEIIWRKKTEKDVASFEMNRIKREKAALIDTSFEDAQVEEFNRTALARRSEKIHAMENLPPPAANEAETDESAPPSSTADQTPYWSLEYGGESDDDHAQYSSSRHGSISDVTLLSRGGESFHSSSTPHLAPHDPPETPRPISSMHHENILEASSSIQYSMPPSPATLAGTMYGPYASEDTSNDTAVQSVLDQIIATQRDFTAEETEYTHIPCLTVSQALDVFRDTVLGLEYLHYQGIIHRDIKPANLLWTASHRVKISDFGVSYLGKPIREDEDEENPDATVPDEAIELAKTVGTPAFYAPELCDPKIFNSENKAERPPLTGQIDVWALGVTLYCMIFGRLPFFDNNEFSMYEKIAAEEVFIPRKRLKGVEDSPKHPMNGNKRFDDIVEYEDVDDELRDLLKRLLHKDPSKRITIKEVKHHPWVLRGIQDTTGWIDETDPNLQSEGRKIEVSNQDVQDAVVGLTIIERFKLGIRRFGSTLNRGRNRESRKRGESNANAPDTSASIHGPKPNPHTGEARRTSLRGDEQIYTALRASRENSDHPLSQSQAASPEIADSEAYFDNADTLMMVDVRHNRQGNRPSIPERTTSTAESMKTIRAPPPPVVRESTSPPEPSEGLSSTTTIADTSSPSGLGGIFGGAGRRFVHSMRSRERGRTRDSVSAGSSRSSSISAAALAPSSIEDPHSSPSLAVSTASAAGHVDQPPALREDVPASTMAPSSQIPLIHESSTEAFQRAQSLNDRRRAFEYSQVPRASPVRHRATSSAANIPCPPSPDDALFPISQQPVAAPPTDEAFGVSSSSDQIASGISESFSHPSIPSVVSGASSFSGSYEYQPTKTVSPSTIVPKKIEGNDRLDDDPADLTPREDNLKVSAEEDEAGYNGEGELDSDSDDGVLEMGGQPKKRPISQGQQHSTAAV